MTRLIIMLVCFLMMALTLFFWEREYRNLRNKAVKEGGAVIENGEVVWSVKEKPIDQGIIYLKN